jgi:hypothetical protein
MTLDIRGSVTEDVMEPLHIDKESRRMAQHTSESGTWPERTMRTTLSLAAWTAAWVATLALAAFGPENLWNEQVAPTVAAIAANALVGVGMLFAHKRYLQSLDELQRSIQMQAMAWSLGAGLVGGMTLTLLDQYDLVAIDATIAQLVIFMGLVYLAGCIAGALRYR